MLVSKLALTFNLKYPLLSTSGMATANSGI